MKTMMLRRIIFEIENFSATLSTNEIEIINFFEDIQEKVAGLLPLPENNRREIITTLFNYLKDQSPVLEENWNFIHLIEDIDKPDYKIYIEILLEQMKKSPNNTSVLLLNRYVNSLKKEELNKYLNIFKEIIENENTSETVKEDAKGFINYQLKKVAE